MGRIVVGAWLVLISLASPSASPQTPFGFQDVFSLARQLAERPFHPPENIPPQFMRLTYDQYQRIRFKRQRALWRDAHRAFQVQFFLPGWVFGHVVTINEVDASGTRRVPFSPDLFEYGKGVPQAPAELGFSGFRLIYPINGESKEDEFIVFQGGSYFRAIGKGQAYGLSARGLAINTGDPGGEEFPAFTEFWLRTPAPQDRAVTIYALLDGPSVAGAYQFDLSPGAPTRTDVTAALFFRRRVALLGTAPLSSMFFHGKSTGRAFGDFRPEVHDSDGALLASGTGEWIWRPLVNPQGVVVSSFSLSSPKGFGLMQRDRAFDHYQDLQARYDIRPSAWIVPHGDWGQGQVRLMEVPTENEYSDNVVAMWVPAHQPDSGTPLRLAYHILWGTEERTLPPGPGGRTVATRIGEDHPGDGSARVPAKLFVVDFTGGSLNALPPDAEVAAIVTAGPGGTIIEQHVQKNPMVAGWRVSFRLQFAGRSPVELRCFLRRGRDVLTETWSYLAQP